MWKTAKVLLKKIKTFRFNNIKKVWEKIFFRIMVSYLLFLFLTISTGILYNNAALKFIENNLKKTNLIVLEQCKDTIDLYMNEIDNLVYQISNNTYITSFCEFDESTGDEFYMKLADIREQLVSYRLPGSFIDKLYIYFFKSDMVVSSNGGATADLVFTSEVKFNNIDYKILKNYLKNQYHNRNFMPSQNVQFNKNLSYNVVTFLQTIPLVSTRKYYGIMMVFIREETIKRLLKNVDVKEGGWVYILDGEGRLITGISSDNHEIKLIDADFNDGNNFKNVTVEGQKMKAFYTISEINDWRYVAVIPENIAMKQLNNVINMIILAIVICFISGVILASLLTINNIKPVKEMLRIISDYFDNRGDNRIYENEYEYLKGNLKEIIRKSKDIEISLKRQVPLIKHAFLNQVLRGETNIRYDKEELERVSGLRLNGNLYGVAAISINNGNKNNEELILLEENSISKVIIETLFKDMESEINYYTTLDSKRIVLLMTSAINDKDELKEKIENEIQNIIKKLQDMYDISAKVGIGMFYNCLNDVYLSYNEAIMALCFYNEEESNNIRWYSDVAEFKEMFYYPVDMETRLINMTLAGEREEIQRILEFTHMENIHKRKLNYMMQKQLIYEMLGTINKIISQIPEAINNSHIKKILDDMMNDFTNVDDLGKAFSNISEYYESICSFINQKKNSRNLMLKNQILEYISASYSDPNLCLSDVASKFEISEAYLSRFFKEQTGETFSEYLERIRIEEACNLLKKSSNLISEVSSMVGYNSSESFRRAFKRVKGVSPSDYRQFFLNNLTEVT